MNTAGQGEGIDTGAIHRAPLEARIAELEAKLARVEALASEDSADALTRHHRAELAAQYGLANGYVPTDAASASEDAIDMVIDRLRDALR